MGTKTSVTAALLVLSIASSGQVMAQNPTGVRGEIDKGDALFAEARRTPGETEGTMDPGPINRSIEAYEKALALEPASTEATWKLLQALYYKGTYALQVKDARVAVFNRAIKIGDKALEKTPESGEIHYWLSAVWGRWSEINGTIASARKGVADKMRDHSEVVIRLMPTYEHGGGFRVLACVHYEAPKVPFILSWPSKEEAVRLLRKSLQIDPDFCLTKQFLAEALHALDEEAEAIAVLEDLLDDPLDPKDLVVFQDSHKEARRLLAEWKGK